MAATLAGFRTRFPEFAATADNLIDLAIEEALLIHALRELATLYCAAHILKLDSDETPQTGEINMARIGPGAMRYKTQADTGKDVFFTRSEYGRRFLTLEKRSPRHAIGTWVF